MCSEFEMARSIKAFSYQPSHSALINLFWMHNFFLSISPAMEKSEIPAANPALVPSIKSGNMLFVPVEIGINGTSIACFTTNRFVPSPPMVIMAATPIFDIFSAAKTVSNSFPFTGIFTGFTSISEVFRRLW